MTGRPAPPGVLSARTCASSRRSSLRPTRALGLAAAWVGMLAGAAWPVRGAAQSAPAAGPTEDLLLADVRAVTGASRYEQDPREAPASISIVTRDEIRRFGYRTIAEVLGSVTGMFTTYDRNYTYLAVRGFTVPGDYNTRILLLLDGHRLNDNVGDDALLGTEAAIDLSVVERIEIIRGASSSLYGGNAYYAVINLVTRDGRSLQGTQVGVEAGSFGSYTARAVFGRRLGGGGEVLAGVTGYTSRGQDLSFPELGGAALGADGDKAARAFLKARKGDWSFEAGGSGRRKIVPTASYGTLFGDAREGTTDARAFGIGAFDHWFADRSRVTLKVSFDRFRYRGDYPYALSMQRDTQAADWLTGEVQYFRPIGAHRVITGLEVRPSLRLDQALFDEAPFKSYLDDRRRSALWALFAQDEVHVGRRLLINAGLRYDHYSTFPGRVSPRVAVIADLGRGTTVKAIGGVGFRAPSAYEQFYEDGGASQKPSSGLVPETIRSLELVVDRQFGASLRASASLYHFDANHLIRLATDSTDGLWIYSNLDQVQSRGVEAEVEARLGSGVVARAGYAYQRPRTSPDDATPVNSPTHLGRLGVMWTAARDRLSGGVEIRGTSARHDLAGGVVPGYALVNLTVLGRPWARGPELAASLYNLLDRRYADPAGQEHRQASIPQDGRALRLAVRYRF